MNKPNRQHGPNTRAIHGRQKVDPSTGAVSPPIFATSTYAQEELGVTKGYDYSRAANPTRTWLEQNLAALEGGIAAPVFASVMAGALRMLSVPTDAPLNNVVLPPDGAPDVHEEV